MLNDPTTNRIASWAWMIHNIHLNHQLVKRHGISEELLKYIMLTIFKIMKLVDGV